MHSDLRGVTLPMDSVRREANCAENERRHEQKQRRWLRSATRAAMRAWGEEIPSKSKSSGDEEKEQNEDKEWEVISSPCALSPKILPTPGGLFGWQAGILAGACWVKWPRADVSGMSSLLP
jgi:hypothetical protein